MAFDPVLYSPIPYEERGCVVVSWALPTNNNEVKVEGITYVFTYVLFYREILK